MADQGQKQQTPPTHSHGTRNAARAAASVTSLEDERKAVAASARTAVAKASKPVKDKATRRRDSKREKGRRNAKALKEAGAPPNPKKRGSAFIVAKFEGGVPRIVGDRSSVGAKAARAQARAAKRERSESRSGDDSEAGGDSSRARSAKKARTSTSNRARHPADSESESEGESDSSEEWTDAAKRDKGTRHRSTGRPDKSRRAAQDKKRKRSSSPQLTWDDYEEIAKERQQQGDRELAEALQRSLAQKGSPTIDSSDESDEVEAVEASAAAAAHSSKRRRTGGAAAAAATAAAAAKPGVSAAEAAAAGSFDRTWPAYRALECQVQDKEWLYAIITVAPPSSHIGTARDVVKAAIDAGTDTPSNTRTGSSDKILQSICHTYWRSNAIPTRAQAGATINQRALASARAQFELKRDQNAAQKERGFAGTALGRAAATKSGAQPKRTAAAGSGASTAQAAAAAAAPPADDSDTRVTAKTIDALRIETEPVLLSAAVLARPGSRLHAAWRKASALTKWRWIGEYPPLLVTEANFEEYLPYRLWVARQRAADPTPEQARAVLAAYDAKQAADAAARRA